MINTFINEYMSIQIYKNGYLTLNIIIHIHTTLSFQIKEI